MAIQITPETLAMAPPPGQVSNLVDPPDFYRWTLGVGITSISIMTVLVCMRTYTKIFIIKNVMHEDYVAILALAGFLAWSGIYIYLASAGMTRDLWNIRAMDLPRLLYLYNAFEVLYGPAVLCAKYFVLVQLRRIFCPPGVRGAVWWALNVIIAFTVAYYISCFFTFLFQCIPREKIWNPGLDGHCIANDDAVLSAGIINLIIDLSVLATPIWAVWRLGMPVKRKLGVIAIFSVGFVTCGLAAAGLAYRIPLTNDPDSTRASARVGLWTFAELTGTIFVGCMPMMPRLWEDRLRPGLVAIVHSSSRALSSLLGSLHPDHISDAPRATSRSSRSASIQKIPACAKNVRVFESNGFVELTEVPHAASADWRQHLETIDAV